MPATNHPETIRQHLALADRAWQKEKGRALWWRAVPLVLGFAVIAVTADAFFQLGASDRIKLDLAGAGLLLVALAVKFYVGWIWKNRAERTARFLEERDSRLGSRLINAIQLAAQAADPSLPEPTRQLAGQAVRSYTSNLTAADLERLPATGEACKMRRRALWASAGFAALLAAFYPVTSVVLPRFFDPLGDHPPYAFTTVEITTPDAKGGEVVYGSTLPVQASWAGHDPRELFLTVHPADQPERSVTLPMIREGDQGFSQEVADVRSDLVLVAHSKDHKVLSQQRLARVILTPKIEKAFLEIRPPAYTGLKPEEAPFAFKSTSALVGSELRFRLRSNRPLRAGSLEILRADQPVQRLALTPRGEHEVEGGWVIDDSARLRFRVTDIDGLASDEQPEALLTATHDLAPTVRMVEPEKDGFVSIGYQLTVKIAASDDYGVKTLRLHQSLNGVFAPPRVTESVGIRRDATASQPVDFAALGAKPGDRLSFFAEAIDTAPEPHLARSQTVTLTLISEQEYNDFLREQNDVRSLSGKYNDLLRQFHQLVAAQAKLSQEAADLQEKTKADPTSAGREASFDALAARQQELNQQLEQMAGRMEKFVRPNPTYDFERDLQKQLSDEAAQIRASTKINRAALDRVTQSTAPANAPRAVTPESVNTLEQEAKEQAARLGAQDQQLAQKVAKPLDDLSLLHDLMNDFNLFAALDQAQQLLASQARAYEKKGTLSREDQLALKDLAQQQQQIGDALAQLPGRLRGHAYAAQLDFPKASASGRQLADAIEQARLAPLADSATSSLLEADGDNGSLLAGRLAEEMSKLVGQCNASQSAAGEDLDQYLKPKLPGKGNSFAQMLQSRKFGLNGRFAGFGKGSASGSGYSMNSGEAPVLGEEPASTNGPQQSGQTSAQGSQGSGTGGQTLSGQQTDAPDMMKNLHPTDRHSGPVSSESSIEEYRSVVDEYFKKITHP